MTSYEAVEWIFDACVRTHTRTHTRTRTHTQVHFNFFQLTMQLLVPWYSDQSERLRFRVFVKGTLHGELNEMKGSLSSGIDRTSYFHP